MASCRVQGRVGSVVILSLCLICSAAALCQQTSRDPSNKNPHSAKTGTAAKNGSPDTNAFPMSQSEAAAKAAAESAAQRNQDSLPQTAPALPDNPPSKQSLDAPSTAKSGSSRSKSVAAQDNPFPEAQSKAAAKADDGTDNSKKVDDSQADSSSASGYSSSDANLPPSDLGQGTLGSHPKLDTFTRDHTRDGRIEDDLKVADLYMKNGNYRGALWRYQDTLQYDPQNDTALYGVAEAMCKQNLTAEAMARFKSYAKNHPQGKYAIKAEKMLAHPNKCMHNW